MQITREEAARIAALAHLRFDDAGLDRMAAEMTSILSYIDQLASVPPVPPVSDPLLPAGSVLRDDVPVAGVDREAVSANAPAWSDGYFLVPRVLGD
jgi:aspartyl/glutamyl-tRNA(Asn/Gln) amidotransferase, C subunit